MVEPPSLKMFKGILNDHLLVMQYYLIPALGTHRPLQDDLLGIQHWQVCVANDDDHVKM